MIAAAAASLLALWFITMDFLALYLLFENEGGIATIEKQRELEGTSSEHQQ